MPEGIFITLNYLKSEISSPSKVLFIDSFIYSLILSSNKIHLHQHFLKCFLMQILVKSVQYV